MKGEEEEGYFVSYLFLGTEFKKTCPGKTRRKIESMRKRKTKTPG
jgi:hypothetical protein